jgi:hypothetical protein
MSRRGQAALAAAMNGRGGDQPNSAPAGRSAGGRTVSGSHAGSHPRGRDSEEGEATSPARGDDGVRLFPAPAPPSNGAQQEARAPATTPATDDATVVDGIRVPAVWVDSGCAGDYSLGFVAGLAADAKTGFKVAWAENSTDTTQQPPFQAGWIAGRQQGTQRQTPAPRRASLEGLVTPAVRARPKFSNRPARAAPRALEAHSQALRTETRRCCGRASQVGGAERRGGVLRLTIKHYLEKAKEGKVSEWLRDFVHCRTKVVTIGGKVSACRTPVPRHAAVHTVQWPDRTRHLCSAANCAYNSSAPTTTRSARRSLCSLTPVWGDAAGCVAPEAAFFR